MTPDTRTNSKLYDFASGRDVLNNLVSRRFPECNILYQYISKLAKEAAVEAGIDQQHPDFASLSPAGLSNEIVSPGEV